MTKSHAKEMIAKDVSSAMGGDGDEVEKDEHVHEDDDTGDEGKEERYTYVNSTGNVQRTFNRARNDWHFFCRERLSVKSTLIN